MATKLQSKTYFPGSVMDLNNGLCNSMWDPYHDDKTTGSEKVLCYDPYITLDGYLRYPKEQIRQTILKQESIFRHQIQELHRLYKRHVDSMNELAMKERYNSTMPTQTPNSNHLHNQKRVIDLELPADVDYDNEKKQLIENVHNLADLNEPIHVTEASFPEPSRSKNSDQVWYLQPESKKTVDQISRKKTLFGVELYESNRNISTLNHNRWIESSGINSKILVSNFLEENHEKRLPPWLMAAKQKETTIYQMNLDSLQHNSHQFFKKPETISGSNVPKFQIDLNSHDPDAETNDSVNENSKINPVTESKHLIDLNLSFDEEQTPSSPPPPPPYIPEIRVSNDEELVKAAAEAIMSISSTPREPPPDTLLRWFATVITSGKTVVKDSDIDYFEYMTLNLQETMEDHPTMIKTKKEEDNDLSRNRKIRKRRKDFQRDVLPGIVSLSRLEVTEDLRTFTGVGVSWRSKKKGGGKNGRGRRLPLPVVAAVEKSLGGWGKRTRRLPRQRCQNGGSHRSLALKC